MASPKIITLKELRVKLTDFTSQIEKEKKSFVVFRKSKPVFKIVPFDEPEWDTVLDFTTIAPQGVPLAKVLKTLRAME